MNINDLTFEQVKELAAMFGNRGEIPPPTPHIGKKCIIRTYASGVHFGTVLAHSGRQVELSNSRRLWRFWAASGISLSAVSQNGIKPEKSKICDVIPQMTILDALEIIPASDAATTSIEGAAVADQT